MGLFNKLKEPIFLKESSNAEYQIEQLKELESSLNADGKAVLRQDIKYLEYGIIGERNIAFELKNSHMPMYILHDIYLEDGDLSAQIDYLIFTRKLCFVIECKNLYGNIEIDNAGNFVRSMQFGGKIKKERIYSPITQNQRHLELMKKMIIDRKGNILTKWIAERGFEDFYRTVVVLANPKAVLNARYAKKADKEKVVFADQLIQYIKNAYNQSTVTICSDEEMLSWAQRFLDMHKNVPKDYTQKYEVYKMTEDKKEKEEVPLEKTELFKELKAYRLSKSREENIKPYFIYNDSQLKDLIEKMPKSKEELQQVSGFGEVKANKYGDEILAIVSKHL